jgi:hypothetical protein
VQELPDIVRIIALLNLSEKSRLDRNTLKRRIDKSCAGHVCVEMEDVDEALKEMSNEGLLTNEDGVIRLTQKGFQISKEWRNLLLKREPILEVVAGLTDGSITSLVAILSAFLASLDAKMTLFVSLLSLTAVAVTNFSSFLLGGKTEDFADLLTLKALMDHSLSDIPDKIERDKSLRLVKQLFVLLRGEIGRSNLFSALIAGTTTYLAGIVPIITFMVLPRPFDILLSLSIVSAIAGVFLVRYRSKRTKVPWKVTLAETVTIIVIAVIASLIISSI